MPASLEKPFVFTISSRRQTKDSSRHTIDPWEPEPSEGWTKHQEPPTQINIDIIQEQRSDGKAPIIISYEL